MRKMSGTAETGVGRSMKIDKTERTMIAIRRFMAVLVLMERREQEHSWYSCNIEPRAGLG